MATTSTINTFLMHFKDAQQQPTSLKGGEKLVDIKSYPALGGEPEKIETTTLSDKVQTFVSGVQQLDSFDFSSNYDKAIYRKLKDLEKKGEGQWWAVAFGADENGQPDGHDGVIVWSGGITAYISEGEVNGVREMHEVFSVASVPVLLPDSSGSV
ncbi:hypothetical protein K6V98_08335 [Collinsella sp. AGMB00827]|uniref:Uncharacterized protein n=1 Tax=Collinsella ureilytica TaxID=2869515 RepID=A0ABS7MM30_9ACTN|nr:hypothetical protein [Collinsella urealyticum]MBY4798352.1 hypothetical protein [Collinsella urealyticum]